MADDLAEIGLSVQTGGLQRGQAELGQLGDRGERTERRVATATGRMQSHFSRVSTAIGAVSAALAAMGVGMVMSRMIREFAAFEKALVEVGKTTDLEGAKLEQLGERIHGIAQEVPLATSRLQSLSVAAGQLGVTGVDNVAKFTETLGKMETATDVAGEQGARSLARLLNITGEAISDVDRLGSSIVALGNNMATTEQEIVQTSTFLAASTQQFNLTAAEVSGLSAQLRAMGQRAETSGSAVGAAMTEISNALESGGENMQALANLTGQTGAQLRESFGENAVGVLADFSEALGQLPAAEQNQVLEQFNLAGRETSRVIGALAADTDGLRKAIAMANGEWERNEALNAEAAKATQTLSAEWQFLQNQFTETSAEIGEELAPALTEIIRQLRDVLGDPAVVQGITNIGEAFVSIIGAVTGAIAKVTEFGKAIGEQIAQMQGYHGGLEDMKERVDEINSVLGRLTDAPAQYRNDARIEALREERSELEALIKTLDDFNESRGGSGGGMPGFSKEIEAQMEWLNRDFSGGGSGSGGASGGSGGGGGWNRNSGGAIGMAASGSQEMVAKERERQEQRLGVIRESLASEMELERTHYERERTFLQEAHVSMFESEMERKNMLLNLERQHEMRKLEIQAQSQSRLYQQQISFLSRLEKAQQSSGAAQVGIMTDAFAQITAAGAQHNKTLFEINKAASIANAVISTHQAATNALAQVPYPYNFAAAAMVTAAGMAKVSAIQSQSFQGGGGAAPSASAGGGVPSTQPASGGGASQQQQQPRTQDIVIRRESRRSGWSDEEVEDMFTQISEKMEDGARLGKVRLT